MGLVISKDCFKLSSGLAYDIIFSTQTNFYNAAVEAKDSFYDHLQDVVNRVPAVDMRIVAGNWNARPGPADPSTRHILGKFTVGTKCTNGERLVNFA